MMLDADVVAVSPSSVYRVLRQAGVIKPRNHQPSLKGKGFQQPLRAHEPWHVDISSINLAGPLFALGSLLDGSSRLLVHGEIRATMTEAEVETIIPRARERFPNERPRIISDNGPQSCEDITLLSAEQRQDGAVVQDPQGGVHPGQDAVIPGRCAADRRGFRGAFPRGPLPQRDR
jgi:hypothetical protein